MAARALTHPMNIFLSTQIYVLKWSLLWKYKGKWTQSLTSRSSQVNQHNSCLWVDSLLLTNTKIFSLNFPFIVIF